MGPSLMDRGLVDRVGLAVRDLGGRVDLVAPGGRVDLDRVVRDLVDPADIRDRAGLAGLGLAGRLDPAGRVDLDRVVRDRVDLAGLADLDLEGRVDPADLVVRVDRHRRRTRPGVLTTGVAPRWAVPGMRRTASAHPATVRRLRPHNTDSAGMAGLRPERRRQTGTDRRPPVDGTVLRLPVVGTAHGTGRCATWQSRSAISGRSITAATTPSRSSTQCSGDGASGSSESGFRCTDTT